VICGEAVVLLSASPSGGVWSTPANTSGEIQPAALANGEYRVAYTLKTPLGCEFSDEETIIVDKLVKPEIVSSSKHVCTNQAVTLTLLNKVAGSSATWFADDRPSVALSSEDNMNVTESGGYFVTVSNHGCSVASDVVLLETKPDSVFIPNVITPNGDSKNEFFEMFSEGVSDMRLIILNRFGDRVFTSSDPTFHWDASNVSNGIYYWYVQYTACSNRRRELKGIVHVLHD
jgi:gliding motility-associated-like protein